MLALIVQAVIVQAVIVQAVIVQAVIEQAGVTSPAQSLVPELITPWELSSPVYSPDGRYVVETGVGDYGWLFEANTQEPLLVVDPGAIDTSVGAGFARDTFVGAGFSFDGSRLVLWGSSGSYAWVDVEARSVLRRELAVSRQHYVSSGIDSAAKRLARCGEKLEVVDLERGEMIFEIEVADRAAFALSGDGTRLLGARSKRVDCWEENGDGKWEERVLADVWCRSIAFFDDDAKVLLMSDYGATVVGVDTGMSLVSAEWKGDPWKLRGLSQRESVAVLVNGGRVRALDLLDLSVLWDRPGSSRWIPLAADVAVTDASNTVWLIVGDRDVVVDIHSGETLWSLDSDRLGSFFNPTSVNANGDAVACWEAGRGWVRRGARDGVDLGDCGIIQSEIGWAGFLSGSPCTVTRHGRVDIVDANLGRSFARRDLGGTIADAHVSEDRVVVCDDAGLGVVLQAPDLERVYEFGAGAEVELSAGGERVLTYGGAMPGVRVVSVETGASQSEYGVAAGRFERAVWSGRGEVVAGVLGLGEVRLWRDGREVLLKRSSENVESLAIDRQGRWLVVGGRASQADVFDTRDGSRIASLRYHDPVDDVWVQRLRFDRRGSCLLSATGTIANVQAWNTSDWSRSWTHTYWMGNSRALSLAIDEANHRVWVWGMTDSTQAAYSLADGNQIVDLADTGLWDFAPSVNGEWVACLRGGKLVLLARDGQVVLERADLGRFGVVISDSSGAVRGDKAALRRTFVRAEDSTLVRADAYGGR